MEPGKITTEIDMLSISQKLLMAQDIWNSIARESGSLLMPEWQINELDKRYEHHKDGKSTLYDWQDVHSRIREKYK